MKTINKITVIALAATLLGCASDKNRCDAYGNFEAIEIFVSSQANGEILEFTIEEGDLLSANQQLGVIDTVQLHLQKAQLKNNIKALQATLPDIGSQINVLKQRLSKAEYEQRRVASLVKADAATTKQLDDIGAEVLLIEKEIIANKSSLTTQERGIIGSIPPIESHIDIIDDLIAKSIIASPINGTVLTKFAYSGELTAQGKPLFKIANIDELICRAYISEPQLSEIKLGQTVTVTIDSSTEGSKQYEGTITWVADKAEFTPKTIQTKEERINLVYAIKIKVKNDGFLKIGMPAEVKFN